MCESDSPLEPRNALELQLLRIWESMLEHRPLGVDSDFFAVGGDSVLALTLMARIVQETGLQLPMSGLMQAPTIEKLAVALRESAGSSAWTPLVPLSSRTDLRKLFIVHPVVGNVMCYLQLAQELEGHVSLYGLQSPSIDGMRPPPPSVEEMAREYVAAVRALQPKGPYWLSGWSFGGVVAYQMAQELRANGDEVEFLGVIDSGHLYSFAVMLSFFQGDSRDMWSRLSSPDAEQLAFFREQYVKAQLIPPNANDALALHIYRTVIANMRILLAYHMKPYDGRIVFFRARDKFIETRRDPEDEWRRVCESVDVVATAGNHLTAIRHPHVAELAQQLRAHLPIG